MRYQLMAIYRGLAFEAGVGPTDEDVVLFAAAPPPGELQFEPVAGQWRRQVSRSELDALWESRPVGRYRGHGCLVLDDLGDRLHIAFQGHDAYQAEQLGYWQVDRGVYEVVVPRHDVTDLTELRDDHPPRWAEPAPSAGAAEMSGALTTQPGSMPGTPVTASLSTQPQRPIPPEQAGARGPAPQEPAAPERVAQESRAASPGPWIVSQEIRTGRRPAPGSPQQPAVPDAAAASGERAAPAPPAPSPRIRSSLPADMMAPAPPREPPANGTGRWHPWVPEPDQAGSWESGAAAPGTNGWNGWDRSPSGGSAGQPGPDSQAGAPGTSSGGHGETAQRDRADTHSIFKELVALAAIPGGSFAIDEDVDGALCLVRTDDGFEVYSSAGNAKHEVRFFDDEESAYFYLFGVLAAEALRSGRLVRRQDE